MIAFIRGVVESVGYDSVVIDVGGVGYGVQLHIRDVSSLRKGQNIEAHISEIIREQAHDLYGFTQIEDKTFFELLLKVSGVGPRIALALMGLASKEEVAGAIQNGDIVLISSAPGIGKRLAERIVVELKDKVGASGMIITTKSSVHNQTEDALLSLGFKPNDIKLMLKDIDTTMSVEEQIRQALKVK